MNDKDEIKALNQRLKILTEECDRLRSENQELKKRFGLKSSNTTQSEPLLRETIKPKNQKVHKNFSTQEKITIFKNLFKGRNDVYASRWDNLE